MPKYFTSIIVGIALAASACGSDDEQTAPAATTDSAVQERLDKLEEEARTARAEARRERAKARRERQRARRARQRAKAVVAATPDPTQEPTEASRGGSGGIAVPNVVGLDHQAAQDALQGEGLWLLDEKDCTGQGRVLLFDRNWEVQSTDPPAGTQVSEDTTITLCSVKQGE